MACPNCGVEINDNRRFCGKCGTDLSPAASSAPDPALTNPAAAPVAPPSTWSAPSTWGAPGTTPPPLPPPPSGYPPPAAERDPFAPPNLYAPPPGFGGPPPPPGYPPPGYPPPGYAPGAFPGYGYAPSTNGFAIAALVLGLVGWILCGVGSVLAIVFGFVARDQIKRSQGRQAGIGMANAGIVLGFVAVAIWLLIFVVSMANAGSGS
jgi:uncharacterized protein DUF4190/zinc ribbon protein